MIDIGILKSALTGELEEIINGRQRELRKISRRMDSELEKVRRKHEAESQKVNERYGEQEREASERYARRASAEMLNQLRADYEVMQARSEQAQITEADVKRAEQTIQLQKIAEETRDEKAKQALLVIVDMGLDPKVMRAMDLVSGRSKTKKDITSYIAVGRAGVYLVSPFDSTKSEGLAKNLENKIYETVDSGDVALGAPKEYDFKRGAPVGPSTHVNFSADINASNGFMIYTLAPSIPAELDKLAKMLSEKFEQLQPEGFKEANLTHRTHVIDPDVVNYFRSHNSSEMYTVEDELAKLQSEGRTSLPYDEAARIIGRTKKAVSMLATKGIVEKTESGEVAIASLINYIANNQRRGGHPKTSDSDKRSSHTKISFYSPDIEATKTEAYKRLDEIEGCMLNSDNINYVLGTGSPSKPSELAKELGIKPGSDRRLYFNKEAIRQYIASRTPTRVGWAKPRE